MEYETNNIVHPSHPNNSTVTKLSRLMPKQPVREMSQGMIIRSIMYPEVENTYKRVREPNKDSWRGWMYYISQR